MPFRCLHCEHERESTPASRSWGLCMSCYTTVPGTELGRELRPGERCTMHVDVCDRDDPHHHYAPNCAQMWTEHPESESEQRCPFVAAKVSL